MFETFSDLEALFSPPPAPVSDVVHVLESDGWTVRRFRSPAAAVAFARECARLGVEAHRESECFRACGVPKSRIPKVPHDPDEDL